jgi:hypothetical protein
MAAVEFPSKRPALGSGMVLGLGCPAAPAFPAVSRLRTAPWQRCPKIGGAESAVSHGA